MHPTSPEPQTHPSHPRVAWDAANPAAAREAGTDQPLPAAVTAEGDVERIQELEACY